MQKIHWKDYLSFTKKERIALLILTGCIAITVALPWLIKPTFSPPENTPALANLLASSAADSSSGIAASIDSAASENTISTTPLFYFDPNTLDKAGWEQLGLSARNIQTILNYRAKGGQFRKAADIHKIYGLKKADADRLEPYIKIELVSKNTSTYQQEKPTYQAPAKKTYKKIHINTATEEEWKSLPGIGDVLAKRIVKFRQSIKGFKSINDVKKTYGLKDSVFQAIVPYLVLE